MVGWVADEQSSTDFAGLAPGLDEDSEERGVGEGHAREVQHDRLTWGEVRLDCALKVVEGRHVNLASQGDDRHEADFNFQLAGHAPNLAVRWVPAVGAAQCPPGNFRGRLPPHEVRPQHKCL